MWATIRASWSLFLGMIFLMVSHGLLATLLTLRAGELGFSESVIGLMQSAYPVGSLLGCLIAPKLIMRVGHIRIFAAFASIASAAALIHLVTDDPWSWSAMRLLAGFCFSGLYIVAESWLNGSANNKTRASLLSVYFVIQSVGLMAGQFLLNLSSPGGIFLFIVASILISFSLVPMLISTSATPPYEAPGRISFIELFHLSPMALSGSFLNGIAQTSLYVVLALYGHAIGLSTGEIGSLVGVMIFGGVVFQFPLAKLSDRIDRRLVMVGAPGLAIPMCFFLASMENPADNQFLLYAMTALLGGLTLPIYSICMAHMHDQLKPGQVVAASGTLFLIMATGMILGPTLGGVAIAQFGPHGFFYLLAATSALTVTTALFRFWSGQSRMYSYKTAVALTANLSPEVTNLYEEAAAQENN
ncbi:MAG: MFS transporter [Magnetovibrio sp.]|nr:MFS transporter [Magnetovibrio sp.]